MDFLDPKKKKSRKIRLFIGHSLMVVLVAFGTFILVLQAYGFDYDRGTGEVIQNGLLYLDSAPDNATIIINGQVHSGPTNTRLSLPSGVYTVEISKPGYLAWQRTFELDGGKVVRFSYPALYLRDLQPQELLTADKSFGLASQSPDRRWIVLQMKNQLNDLIVYDLGKRQDQKPVAKTINLPGGILTPAKGEHSLELVEWSTDNKNILVSHKFSGGQEFAVINIDKPTLSYNVNQKIGLDPDKVTLFDKKPEKLYIYDSAKQTLRLIDVENQETKLIASDVISYKTHGDNRIFMAVNSVSDKNKADIVLRENDENYFIRQIPKSDKIPLEFARSDNDWYGVIGVETEKRTYIYKNPLEFIKPNSDLNKSSLLALKNSGPIEQVAFSQNTRFILSQSGQSIATYDIETGKRYGYKIKQTFDKGAKLSWMDGHRLLTRSNGKVLVFDFNGINIRQLIPADKNFPIMFDRDYTELYSLGSSKKDNKKFGFFMTELRLEEDK